MEQDYFQQYMVTGQEAKDKTINLQIWIIKYKTQATGIFTVTVVHMRTICPKKL